MEQLNIEEGKKIKQQIIINFGILTLSVLVIVLSNYFKVKIDIGNETITLIQCLKRCLNRSLNADLVFAMISALLANFTWRFIDNDFFKTSAIYIVGMGNLFVVLAIGYGYLLIKTDIVFIKIMLVFFAVFYAIDYFSIYIELRKRTKVEKYDQDQVGYQRLE